MAKRPQAGQFTKEEAQQRFEAALRGARAVGHKQLKDISPKRPEARRKSGKPGRHENV
jgi:hypothetical protein